MLNRRSFLGWTVAVLGLPTTKSVAKTKKPNKVMVLGCEQCPKCGYWMHLPKEPKYSHNYIKITGGNCTTDGAPMQWSRRKLIAITCSCDKCDYSVTAEVLCDVQPRVE